MNARLLGQVGLIVLLLGLAGSMVFRSCRGPRIDFGPYQALGIVAGQEAAKLVPAPGQLVLVVPDQSAGADPVLEAQLAAFRQALKKARGPQIKATEVVAMDPFTRMQTGGALPPDRYVALRRSHTDAAGFVLFFGFPPLTPAEIEGLQSTPAKVLVISAGLPGYDALLRSGAMDVALVPRPVVADSPAAPPASIQEAFDREYVVLRSAGR